MRSELIIEPGKVSTMPEFVEESDACTIALDGRVPGRNNYLVHGTKAPIVSIDHHTGVDRIGTGATCKQTLDHLRLGLRETFSINGRYQVTGKINDCDQDVCTSWWLLKHPEMAEATNGNPAVGRLVGVESNLDVTGGLYPYDKDMAFLAVLKTIYRPYTRFRADGGLDNLDPEQYRTVIESVCSRITDHVIGNPIEPTELDTEFETLRTGTGWSLVHEIGEDARMGIGSSAIKGFIAVRETTEDGVYRYTIAKKSPLVGLPVEQLYKEYNKVDPTVTATNFWSGSDTIGGSPRTTGSRLSPDTLFDITESYIQDNLVL